MNCNKCHLKLVEGQALLSTLVGSPDDIGGDGMTMNYGGPGRLVKCLKCPQCGFSRLPGPVPEFVDETFTVFSTRNVYEDGIVEVLVRHSAVPGRVEYVDDPQKFLIGEGQDWHRTREGAVKKARRMQFNKLRKLAKTYTKIQSLKFE